MAKSLAKLVSHCLPVFLLWFHSPTMAQESDANTATTANGPEVDRLVAADPTHPNDSIVSRSNYHLVLGSGHTLLPDGSFSSGILASIYSSTAYPLKNVWPFSNYLTDDSERTIQGSIELTFIELDDLEDTTTPAIIQNQNPFTSGKGILKFSAAVDPGYLSSQGTEGLGARLGVGFSTRPNDTATDVDTAPRVFGGLVFRANYGNTGNSNGDDEEVEGVGEIFLGLSHDRFWQFTETEIGGDMSVRNVNEKNRFVVDGRMDLPGVLSSDQVRLHARAYADLPLSGKGPSDIRLSLLLSIKIDKFLGLK